MTDLLCRVEVERRGEVSVARLEGEIDASNVDFIEKELELFVSGRGRLYVVDLSSVVYLDSAGIRLLFDVAGRLRTRRQELHVIVPEESVIRRVMEITDFPRMVPVHASLHPFGR